jgi:hypothetical protein
VLNGLHLDLQVRGGAVAGRVAHGGEAGLLVGAGLDRRRVTAGVADAGVADVREGASGPHAGPNGDEGATGDGQLGRGLDRAAQLGRVDDRVRDTGGGVGVEAEGVDELVGRPAPGGDGGELGELADRPGGHVVVDGRGVVGGRGDRGHVAS